MKVIRRIRWVLISVLVAGVVLASDGTGLAQCSMCRLSLAGSQGAEFIRNFNIGVLVLLVPPVVMFCSIFIVLRRFSGSDKSH